MKILTYNVRHQIKPVNLSGHLENIGFLCSKFAPWAIQL